MRQGLRSFFVATVVAGPLICQPGNEVIFIGTAGSNSSPHFFLASGTGAVSVPAASNLAGGAWGAAWTNQGRDLYLARAYPAPPATLLVGDVTHTSWNGTSATWSPFWASAPGACFGIGIDSNRQLLWVLSGPRASNRELYCLDLDPASVLYGTVLAQTSVLSGSFHEGWGLSPLGNIAVVADGTLGNISIIDTDPASPTFLQRIGWYWVGTGLQFSIGFDAAISINERYAYVSYSGLNAGVGAGGLAVLDRWTGSWLDFDPAPGQQHFAITLGLVNRMDLAIDMSFAVVTAIGNSSGATGGALRIDFDYANPTLSTGTEYLPGQLGNANWPTLSPNGDRVALGIPGQAVILDANTGALLSSTPLPSGSGSRAMAWQDRSPTATYQSLGGGCPGTLGTPTLAAAAGTRPALGTTFSVSISQLPANLAVLGTGWSNTMWAGLTLPLDLMGLGAPGCSWMVAPATSDLVTGTGNVAGWSWTIPASPVYFGLTFYQQALVLDPGINALGATVSNSGEGWIGF